MKSPLAASVLILSIFLPLALCGCGQDIAPAPEPVEGYVGGVDETDAFIAIVTGERDAMAYVCDGDNEIFEWFDGPHDGPADLALDNAQGGSLSASRVGDAVLGEVTLADGTTHSFTAEAASGEAGLYRVLGEEAQAAELQAGWIVDNDGSQRGALRRRRVFEPAPRLPDSGLKLGGVTYPVFKIEIELMPPSPPAGPIPVPYPNIGTVAK